MWSFSWSYTAQTVRLHQNLRTKGTSLGCRLAPETIPLPTIVPFELQRYHKHTTVEYRILGCSVTRKTPCAEIGKNFQRYTHAESDSRLLFQKWSKSLQDKWPKGRVALITQKNKTRFGTLGRNPWGDFAHFSYVTAHRGPPVTFQFSST